MQLSIRMHLEGEEFLNQYTMNDTIFHICQEGITNAVKHGLAQSVELYIKADKYKVYISVSDDGLGCSKFINGFGLSGLTRRVQAIHGIMDFKLGLENGFAIEASLFLNTPSSAG